MLLDGTWPRRFARLPARREAHRGQTRPASHWCHRRRWNAPSSPASNSSGSHGRRLHRGDPRRRGGHRRAQSARGCGPHGADEGYRGVSAAHHEIAATLNPMGMRTGMGNTWTGYLLQRTREEYPIGNPSVRPSATRLLGAQSPRTRPCRRLASILRMAVRDSGWRWWLVFFLLPYFHRHISISLRFHGARRQGVFLRDTRLRARGHPPSPVEPKRLLRPPTPWPLARSHARSPIRASSR